MAASLLTDWYKMALYLGSQEASRSRLSFLYIYDAISHLFVSLAMAILDAYKDAGNTPLAGRATFAGHGLLATSRGP
jgi:hypothetical protein